MLIGVVVRGSVWVPMLSELLCRLVSHPFCMGLYIVRHTISLGLTSVLYGSLCCQSPYVAWSRIRSVWVSILSDILFHLVSLQFCMSPYVVRVSMSLGLNSILYWVSMLFDFLFHLVSLQFCTDLYVVRVLCVTTGYNESITLNSKEILLKRERSVVNVT
jgi:hypothetical protein